MKFLKAIILSSVAVVGMAVSQVNINTANVDELSALSGIGPKKAAAIIKYRRANGKFKSVADLTNVEGIGEVTVNNLGRDAKVSGRTDVTKVSKTKAKKTVAKKTKAAKRKSATSTDKTAKTKASKSKSSKSKRASKSTAKTADKKTKVKKTSKSKAPTKKTTKKQSSKKADKKQLKKKLKKKTSN